MKDYRLSEIKEICENAVHHNSCNVCPFTKYCDGCSLDLLLPYLWNIDESIKDPSKDDIILAVKQTIGSFGTLDGNDIDHIAEQIAKEILKRQ